MTIKITDGTPQPLGPDDLEAGVIYRDRFGATILMGTNSNGILFGGKRPTGSFIARDPGRACRFPLYRAPKGTRLEVEQE